MDIRVAHRSILAAKGNQPSILRTSENVEFTPQEDSFELNRAERNYWDRHLGLSSVHSSGGRTHSKYRHSDGLRATVAATDMGLIATGSMLAGMPELAQLWGGAPAVVAGGVAVAAGIHLIASLCQMSTDGPIPLVTRPLLRRR